MPPATCSPVHARWMHAPSSRSAGPKGACGLRALVEGCGAREGSSGWFRAAVFLQQGFFLGT